MYANAPMKRRPPSAAPTPIPAFAPVLREPFDELESERDPFNAVGLPDVLD